MVRTGERNLFHDRSIVYAVTGFGLNPTLAILQNNSKLHKIFLSLFTRININLYSLILSERPVIWMLHLNFTVSDIYKRWCWKYNFGETILTYHWKSYDVVTQARRVKLVRQNYSETVDSCPTKKSKTSWPSNRKNRSSSNWWRHHIIMSLAEIVRPAKYSCCINYRPVLWV